MKKEYYPETKYTKAKSAKPGEFIVKDTRDLYKGLFVETSDKRYFSGKSPMDTGIELEKVVSSLNLKAIIAPLLAGSLGGFFKKIATSSERENGVLKRYFIQDKNNSKITEVDKPTYLQAQKDLVNTNFAQVDWIIKGPAENQMFGNYPFEGAESKNKKTIQALESQMKGISTFITDYKYLVEDPAVAEKPVLTSEAFTEKDASTQLQDSRKANFDYKSDSTFPGPSLPGTEVVVVVEPLKTLWTFTSSSLLDWPTDQSGYTEYQGGWTDIDDGFAQDPILLPTAFYINNVGSTNLYVGTNGCFTLGAGDDGNPPDLLNPPGAAANKSDLYLDPSSPPNDGSIPGLWTKVVSNGTIHSISLLVYGTFYGYQNEPSSYILNFYRDTVYEYVETRLRYNLYPVQSGPYNNLSVYQVPSTNSKVWRGDLLGLNWEYLGEGVLL